MAPGIPQRLLEILLKLTLIHRRGPFLISIFQIRFYQLVIATCVYCPIVIRVSMFVR